MRRAMRVVQPGRRTVLGRLPVVAAALVLSLALLAAQSSAQAQSTPTPTPSASPSPIPIPTPTQINSDISSGSNVINLGSGFLERLGNQATSSVDRTQRD